MRKIAIIFAFLLFVSPTLVFGHSSGCHRWHSCSSDTGSYVCGDLGYCSQCSDNEYCVSGVSRSTIQSSPEVISPPVLTPTPTPTPAPTPAPSLPFSTPSIPLLFFVNRVIDGDTIEITDEYGLAKKVRLTGIDTPETVDPRKLVQCFGREASEKTKSLVEGKYVRLEQDSIGDTIDRYGRLLRYVYVGDIFVNMELLKQGYAYAYLEFPFSKSFEFKQYENEARENKKGLWAPGVCTIPISLTPPQTNTPRTSQQSPSSSEIARPKFTKNLKKGMRNIAVSQLQAALAQDPQVYPEGIISGYFGKSTEQAVKRFQKKHGIEQTGTVGPKTLQKLNEIFK